MTDLSGVFSSSEIFHKQVHIPSAHEHTPHPNYYLPDERRSNRRIYIVELNNFNTSYSTLAAVVAVSVDIDGIFVICDTLATPTVGCMADGLLPVVAVGPVSWERISFEMASLRQQLAFCTGVTPE